MRSIGHSDPNPIEMDAAGNSRSLGALSTSAPPADRTIRKKAILIFCLLMFCYAYVHQRSGWNQNSRLDLLHAIFVHKTLTIDAYHENTGDKSIHNGHYYSDKAPGIVVLALPAFALSAGLLRVLDVDIDSPEGWLISDWITTALSVGLIAAAGGAAIFLLLSKIVPPSCAMLTTLAAFLGSLPFPYATMLFSHAAVIGLLSIALWAIADDAFLIRHHLSDQSKIQNPKSKIDSTFNWRQRHILAGLCCGFAIASEFPAAISAGGILALSLLQSFKRGTLLMLAAIPPMLLVPTYNWVCFGHPSAFGYHLLAEQGFQAMNKGLFGITWPPKPEAAYLLLVSQQRGLFFWSPVMLLAFWGLLPFWKASGQVFLVAAAVVGIQVIAMAGYYMPGGGAALGPRHLAPMLPFLLLFVAYGFVSCQTIGMLLGYVSIGLTSMATALDAMPSEKVTHLIATHYLPRFFNGSFQRTISSSLGLPSDLSFWILMLCSFGLFVFVWLGCTRSKP